MARPRFGLYEDEYQTLFALRTPDRIQDFLDALPVNFENEGETCMSPRRVLRAGRAHCMEGALLAATALMLQGEKGLLLDLKSTDADDDHVVALYRRNGLWGAISKTNHATLRYRDPIYRTIRELALSYFHEYFLSETGVKTLRSYAGPFPLARFGEEWITSEDELWDLCIALDDAKHEPLFPPGALRHLRLADSMERKAGALVEWRTQNRKTA